MKNKVGKVDDSTAVATESVINDDPCSIENNEQHNNYPTDIRDQDTLNTTQDNARLGLLRALASYNSSDPPRRPKLLKLMTNKPTIYSKNSTLFCEILLSTITPFKNYTLNYCVAVSLLR